MSIPPEVMDAVYKLVLATALGGLLGLERERKHRAAGLRTHIVVCLAATLVMIISNRLPSSAKGKSTPSCRRPAHCGS